MCVCMCIYTVYTMCIYIICIYIIVLYINHILVPCLLMMIVLVTFLFLVLYKGIWWWWITKDGSIKASIWHSQDAFSWALAKAMSGWNHNHTGTLGMESNPNNVGFIESFRSVRGILAGVCLNFCCPRVYVCIAECTIKDMHSTTIEPFIYMQALYLHIDVIMRAHVKHLSAQQLHEQTWKDLSQFGPWSFWVVGR